MRRAAVLLVLAGCGDDRGLPAYTNAWFAGELVRGGDAVYVACGYGGSDLCAQHGDGALEVLASTETFVTVFPGLEGRAAAVVVTEDGADVVEIDPVTDELIRLGPVDDWGAPPFRAGQRVVVDQVAIGRDGDRYELPFDGALIAEGPDAAYLRDDGVVWRTDGTADGTFTLDGFARITGVAPRAGGATIVGDVGDDTAVWAWTVAGTSKVLDLDDDRPAATRVLCDDVLLVDRHLVTTDGRQLDTPELPLVSGSAGDDDACYVVAASLWRIPRGGEAEELVALGADPVMGAAMLARGVLRFLGPADTLWISDGTAGGTHPDWDLDFGPYAETPRSLVATDHWLYFLDGIYPPDDSPGGLEDERCIFTSCEYLFSVALE